MAFFGLISFDQLRVVLALLGLCIGFGAGAKLRQYYPAAHTWTAIAGACLAYVFAFLIVIAALIVVSIVAFIVLLRFAPFCRQVILKFSERAGNFTHRRLHAPASFKQRLDLIDDTHRQRLQAIMQGNRPEDAQAILRDREEARYNRELAQLE